MIQSLSYHRSSSPHDGWIMEVTYDDGRKTMGYYPTWEEARQAGIDLLPE